MRSAICRTFRKFFIREKGETLHWKKRRDKRGEIKEEEKSPERREQRHRKERKKYRVSEARQQWCLAESNVFNNKSRKQDIKM